jgi:hypothetical protein
MRPITLSGRRKSINEERWLNPSQNLSQNLSQNPSQMPQTIDNGPMPHPYTNTHQT